VVRPIRRISAASSTVRNAGSGLRASPAVVPGDGVGSGNEELVEAGELWSMTVMPFRSEQIGRLLRKRSGSTTRPASGERTLPIP